MDEDVKQVLEATVGDLREYLRVGRGDIRTLQETVLQHGKVLDAIQRMFLFGNGEKPIIVQVPLLDEQVERLASQVAGIVTALAEAKAQARSDRVKIVIAVLTLLGAALTAWISSN